MEKPVALGADHGGFALKEAVRAHLDERGVPYVDYGTHSEASVDYPDMAVPPCEAVVRGECACALLFCGTGVGISMAANKLLPILAGGTDITVSPSFNSIAVAFGISVGIGVLFGYLPARRAARLNPIEALRYD